MPHHKLSLVTEWAKHTIDILWRIIWSWPVIVVTALAAADLLLITLILPESLVHMLATENGSSGWARLVSSMDAWRIQNMSAPVMRTILFLIAGLAILRIAARFVPRWRRPTYPSDGLCLPLNLSPDTARNSLADALENHGLYLPDNWQGEPILVRRRHWLTWLAESLPDLTLILLVCASQIQAFGAWRGDVTQLVLAEPQRVASTTDLEATLQEIEISAIEGRDSLKSQIALSQQDAPLGVAQLWPGRRARIGNLLLHQLGYGPSIHVQTSDNTGPIGLQAMSAGNSGSNLRIPFSEEQRERVYAIPSHNLIVQLVYYDSHPQLPEAHGVLQVQGIHGQDGQQLFERFLAQNGRVSAQDIQLDIAFEYYVMFYAHHEPQYLWSGLALLLGLIGLTYMALRPPRIIWLETREGQGAQTRGICIYGSAHTRRQRWFTDLVESLPKEETRDGQQPSFPTIEQRRS